MVQGDGTRRELVIYDSFITSNKGWGINPTMPDGYLNGHKTIITPSKFRLNISVHVHYNVKPR